MYTRLASQIWREYKEPTHITGRPRHLGNFRGTRLAAEWVTLPCPLVIVLGFDPTDLVGIP